MKLAILAEILSRGVDFELGDDGLIGGGFSFGYESRWSTVTLFDIDHNSLVLTILRRY